MPLGTKSEGKAIMISQYLCECHGQLYRMEDGEKVYARRIITSGKEDSDDGWWRSEHMADQLDNHVVPVFDDMHPDCVAVFMFDNSSNHKELPDDALDTENLNLSDGGKNARTGICDGYFELNNETVFQKICHGNSVQKGNRSILVERGLWEHKMKLKQAREKLR